MKSIKKLLLVILIISGIMMTGCRKNNSPDAAGTIKMGISRVDITPDVPVRMAGYAGRTDPFNAIHDHLYSTAMVFNDGVTTAILITADLIGFSIAFCNETATIIEKETGISKDNILISATHTHGGPVTRVYNDSLAQAELDYIDDLQQTIIRASVNASQDLQPVHMGIGSGICNMNINRRARYADGTVYIGLNPEGVCDHNVTVVRIDDIDSNPLAVFVNWPCHGTVGSSRNTRITGDWPGSAARFVSANFGDNLIVPVTAGASGNIKPLYGPDERFDHIDATGMLVGEVVIDVAKKIQTSSEGSVRIITKTIKAKGKKTIQRSNRVFPQEFEPADDVDLTLSALRVGNILFAGISGEVMTEIGLTIKERSPVENTVIITHCNGSSGYLCTDEAYEEGGYEVIVSRTMPGTAKLIEDNMLEMISSIN